MSKDHLTSQDLKRMKESMTLIRQSIHSLAQRITKDSIVFEWQSDGRREEISFTRVWGEIAGGAFGRALDTVSQNVSLIVYSAVSGIIIPKHRHPHQSQTIFVAEGKIAVWNDGEKHVLEPNGTILIQKNVYHSIMVYEEATLISRYVPRQFVEVETLEVMETMSNDPPSEQKET